MAPMQPATEREPMKPEFTSERLRFLLRRWRWVAVGSLIGVGVAVASILTVPKSYVAQSVLVGTNVAVEPEDFGGVAQAAFSTDAVLQPVIDRLGLRATPRSLLSSGAVEAQSISGGPALRVTGRASDPKLAADLANAAAESFAIVAEEKGLGTLASFTTEGLGTRQTVPTVPTIVLGLVAGAGLAILVLLGLYFFRDPVVTDQDASDDFASDVAFHVTVDAVPAVRRMRGDGIPHDAFDVRPSGAIPRLWNAIREGVDGSSSGACAVILDGGKSDWAAEAIGRQLREQAETDPTWRKRSIPFSLLKASDPRLPGALANQEAVIAIVNADAPRRSLRRFDEDLQSSGDFFRVLIVVAPRR